MISQNVWAPPFFFGPWVELENHTGDILSNVPGPFIAFIWYAPNGPRTVNVIGPASYQISCKGAGVDKIKFKSVSGTGQIIHVYTTL
ncbi:colicin Z C-terminal domain-related protein [Escherichia coli]